MLLRQRQTLEQRRSAVVRRYERSRDAWADGNEPLEWLEAERLRRDAALAEIDAALDALPTLPDPATYASIGAMLTDVRTIISAASDDALRAAMVALGVAVVSGEGVQIAYGPGIRDFVSAPHVASV